MISLEHLGFEFGHPFVFSEVFRQVILHVVLVNASKERKQLVLTKYSLKVREQSEFGSVRNGGVLVGGKEFGQIKVILLK